MNNLQGLIYYKRETNQQLHTLIQSSPWAHMTPKFTVNHSN